MQDFIQSAVSQLGLDESTVKSATGSVLGFLKNSLGDQFANVADQLPGAEQLIQESESATSEGDAGGGLLGSITDAASSLLGGNAGEGVELFSSLQKTGLTAEQGSSFVTMLIEFIKDKLGAETLDQILEKVPMLKSLVG